MGSGRSSRIGPRSALEVGHVKFTGVCMEAMSNLQREERKSSRRRSPPLERSSSALPDANGDVKIVTGHAACYEDSRAVGRESISSAQEPRAGHCVNELQSEAKEATELTTITQELVQRHLRLLGFLWRCKVPSHQHASWAHPQRHVRILDGYLFRVLETGRMEVQQARATSGVVRQRKYSQMPTSTLTRLHSSSHAFNEVTGSLLRLGLESQSWSWTTFTASPPPPARHDFARGVCQLESNLNHSKPVLAAPQLHHPNHALRESRQVCASFSSPHPF